MPLYDYRCQDCGHEFEVLQAVNDPAPDSCPTCGNKQVKKKVVAPSFTFKGGGWYKDLYGSSGKSSSEKAAPKTESSTPKKESKPAKTSGDS